MAKAQPRQWLGVREVCERLRISRGTLWNWCRKGLLTRHRPGERRIFFDSREVDTLIARSAVK